MEFITLRLVFIIIHLIGLALGLGSAAVTDALFMKAMRAGKLASAELKFMKLTSSFVWLGVLLLLVSGIGLFSMHADAYMDSGKFLAKMTVVAILILNGALFHFVHLPRLTRVTDIDLKTSDDFRRSSLTLFMSGGISTLSWLTALVLGAAGRIPYSYICILSVYLGVAIIAILASLGMRAKLLKK